MRPLIFSRELGDDTVKPTGPIPAHLLNMWAQNWGHLYEMLEPFPSKTVPDVTKQMKDKGWTKTKILKKAEEFFVSIGLFYRKKDKNFVLLMVRKFDIFSSDNFH